MKLKTRPYITQDTIARWCDVLEHLDGKRTDDVSEVLYIHPSSVIKRIEYLERAVGEPIAERPPRGTRYQPWRLTPIGRQVLEANR